jgi:metal-responsive CopG/Arc/MetJ family transcriptional regulator
LPRTIIDIPANQLHEVDRLCKLLNISRAEAVRRGLQDFVKLNEPVKTEGFGLWKDSGRPRDELIRDLRIHR